MSWKDFFGGASAGYTLQQWCQMDVEDGKRQISKFVDRASAAEIQKMKTTMTMAALTPLANREEKSKVAAYYAFLKSIE